jgi:hypothetical protein
LAPDGDGRAPLLPKWDVAEVGQWVESSAKSRPWKDHFKSDFRSDQDHLLEKESQIRFFLMILILDLKSRDQR